jgi:hypothetical protein
MANLITVTIISTVIETFLFGFLCLLFVASTTTAIQHFKRLQGYDHSSSSSRDSRNSRPKVSLLWFTLEYLSRPFNVGPIILFICATVVWDAFICDSFMALNSPHQSIGVCQSLKFSLLSKLYARLLFMMDLKRWNTCRIGKVL